MSKKEYIKEDILKFLGGTSSIINTLIAEMEERIKIRVEKVISKFDIVSKSEFEIALALAEKARKENISLSKKINSLEKKVYALTKGKLKK